MSKATPIAAGLALALAGAGAALANEPPAARPVPLEEALEQATLHPEDAYTQFVALQVAAREGRLEKAASTLDRLRRRDRGRGDDIDLFGLFTGALAVQENLQLDAMRGGLRPTEGGEAVLVASLEGPSIESHPWAEMLEGRRPEVPALSMAVPSDFYLATFHSLERMLDGLDAMDGWGTYFLTQASGEATTQALAERLKDQLAVETDRLARPFYDSVVEDVAVTGSDLFVREGSDVTLIFRVKSPEVFKKRMDGYLEKAAARHPAAARTDGKHLGIPYVGLQTADRALSVWSCYPRPDLHLRSNSQVALHRIIEAVVGGRPDGAKVERLGDTLELRFARIALPKDAGEDGFVYLSDPFIRRIVGPAKKLTEVRRLLCYTHLRVLGHAALLHRTEQGRAAAAIDDLVKAGCLGEALAGAACPDGGTYSLAEGVGACSRHGTARFLTPCIEVEATAVSEAEAERYRAFVQEYDAYWRTFFDPIAIRLHVERDRLRAETLVLPLIDNSIYEGLASAPLARPADLASAPLAEGTLLSIFLGLDLAPLVDPEESARAAGDLLRELGLPRGREIVLPFDDLLRRGIGSSFGFHVMDAEPFFELNLPEFLGEMMSTAGRRMSDEAPIAAFIVTSLNAPVYVSADVKDPAVVDRFLAALDEALARVARIPVRGGFWEASTDFTLVPTEGDIAMRALVLAFGPVRLRFFWARVGDGLYVASQPEPIDALAGGRAARLPEDSPARQPAQAVLRVDPRAWQKVRADYELGWSESARRACLQNLGALDGLSRAGLATGADAGARGAQAMAASATHLGALRFCPDGGRYLVEEADGPVRCDRHGTVLRPRQPRRLDPDGPLGGVIGRFDGLTCRLAFEHDGLRATLDLQRRAGP